MLKTVLIWIGALTGTLACICVVLALGCYYVVGHILESSLSDATISGIQGCGSSGTINQASSLIPGVTVLSARWFLKPAEILHPAELIYAAQLKASRKIPADSVLIVFQGPPRPRQGSDGRFSAVRYAVPIFSDPPRYDAKGEQIFASAMDTIPTDTAFGVEISRDLIGGEKDALDSLLTPYVCPTNVTVVALAAKEDYLGVTVDIRSDTARMLDSIRALRPLREIEILILKRNTGEEIDLDPRTTVAINTTGHTLRHQDLSYSYVDSNGGRGMSHTRRSPGPVYERAQETTTIDSLLPHEAKVIDGLFADRIKSSTKVILGPEKAKPSAK